MSTATPSPSAGPVTVDRETLRRAGSASFISTFVEWFDYATYIYVAGIIATLFFPSDNRAAALMSTFAVFALGYFTRPIGGMVWGHLGDRLGRRWALSWSILIMSASTFLIAFLPTHAQVGLLAPFLLLLLRMVQSFSAAGEYAGASAFLTEYAPPGKRGIFTALVPASVSLGFLVGSLLMTGLTAMLSTAQLESWGWRLPFLLAGPLGLVGRYIRVKLQDSPAFQQMEQTGHKDASPLVDVVKNYPKELAIAFGIASLNAVGFYMVLGYMPTYLSEELGVGKTASFVVASFAAAIYTISIFVMGHWSDKVGRRRMLNIASVLFIVGTVPLFMVLDGAPFWLLVVVDILFGIMLTINDGTLPTFLSEVFPTKVRYSGFALSFNLANAILGGTTPLVSTWLIHVTGTKLAPAMYLSFWAVIALIAMLASKETAFEELRTD